MSCVNIDILHREKKGGPVEESKMCLVQTEQARDLNTHAQVKKWGRARCGLLSKFFTLLSTGPGSPRVQASQRMHAVLEQVNARVSISLPLACVLARTHAKETLSIQVPATGGTQGTESLAALVSLQLSFLTT